MCRLPITYELKTVASSAENDEEVCPTELLVIYDDNYNFQD